MNSDDLGIIQSGAGLVADVRSMIEQTREDVARTVNAGMTLLYWRIGKRIQTEVLQNERAEYGKEIVQSLSAQLSWTTAASTSPNTSPPCRRASCFGKNSTPPSRFHGHGWKTGKEALSEDGEF